jgi:hypothetical protein
MEGNYHPLLQRKQQFIKYDIGPWKHMEKMRNANCLVRIHGGEGPIGKPG